MAAILPAGYAGGRHRHRQPRHQLGGRLHPTNDRVDVIRTYRDDAASKNSGTDVQLSQTILRDIRVLAVGQLIQEKNGTNVVTGETATLALTPSQAETVTLAERSAPSPWPCAASPMPGRARIPPRPPSRSSPPSIRG